jgi:hypothetical protein
MVRPISTEVIKKLINSYEHMKIVGKLIIIGKLINVTVREDTERMIALTKWWVIPVQVTTVVAFAFNSVIAFRDGCSGVGTAWVIGLLGMATGLFFAIYKLLKLKERLRELALKSLEDF